MEEKTLFDGLDDNEDALALPLVTIEDGRKFVDQGKFTKDGVECPCCGKLAKAYLRPLNSNMATFLVSLVRKYEETDGPVHYTECRYRGLDYAFLELWKLARLMENEDTGKRSSGLWLPTMKGIDFVHGRITVPAKVLEYRRQALKFTDNHISIREAFKKPFHYDEMMAEPIERPEEEQDGDPTE